MNAPSTQYRKPAQPKENEREPLLGVAVGKKGIGKTYETLKMIDRYIKPNARTGAKARRVLIFDVNGEFTQFPTIALKDIRKWCRGGRIEVRRVNIFKTEQDEELGIFKNPKGKMTLDEMASALHFMLDCFHDGMLLIEDINKYVSDSLPNDLIGAICTQRHIGVDVVMHFQSIGKFGHPKILANASWLRFHKVSDTVIRHANKFNEYTEPLQILESLVNAKFAVGKNIAEKSFHAYYDLDDYKIKGRFTKRQFMHAIEKYLEKNYNRVVKPRLKEVNLTTGEAKHTNQGELINNLISQFIVQYYGNPK